MRQNSFVFTLVFFFLSSFAFSQELDLNDNRQTVYWFTLGLKYVKDKKMKVYTYKVYKTNATIRVGNLEEFAHKLWEARSSGNKLVVGPFTTREEVEFALKVFDPKNISSPHIINNDSIFYWYVVRLGRYSRLNSYRFEHIPAAVGEGTIKDFIANLETAMYNQSVVIGPFTSRLEAELSKRIYRQQE